MLTLLLPNWHSLPIPSFALHSTTPTPCISSLDVNTYSGTARLLHQWQMRSREVEWGTASSLPSHISLTPTITIPPPNTHNTDSHYILTSSSDTVGTSTVSLVGAGAPASGMPLPPSPPPPPAKRSRYTTTERSPLAYYYLVSRWPPAFEGIICSRYPEKQMLSAFSVIPCSVALVWRGIYLFCPKLRSHWSLSLLSKASVLLLTRMCAVYVHEFYSALIMYLLHAPCRASVHYCGVDFQIWYD